MRINISLEDMGEILVSVDHQEEPHLIKVSKVSRAEFINVQGKSPAFLPFV
jgi:hypothetical protein